MLQARRQYTVNLRGERQQERTGGPEKAEEGVVCEGRVEDDERVGPCVRSRRDQERAGGPGLGRLGCHRESQSVITAVAGGKVRVGARGLRGERVLRIGSSSGKSVWLQLAQPPPYDYRRCLELVARVDAG